MRLRVFAAVVLLAVGVSPAALAQVPQSPAFAVPQRPPSPSPPPSQPPTTQAPPIVFPFPPLMPPPTGGLNPRFAEEPRFQTFSPLFFPGGGGTVYGPYYYPYDYPYDSSKSFKRGARRVPLPAPPATGLLRIDVTPGTAQVYVDSYYVGTVDDVNAQRVLTLEAGPHRLEFRAPQYRTSTVDVRVLPYETVTYRGTLEAERAAPAPVAPAAAGPPTPMYVIPNCYLGNVPPRASRLPSGCDVKNVQVVGK
jgi:hypothetical protein